LGAGKTPGEARCRLIGRHAWRFSRLINRFYPGNIGEEVGRTQQQIGCRGTSLDVGIPPQSRNEGNSRSGASIVKSDLANCIPLVRGRVRESQEMGACVQK
jgi:hypothetical protein